jgi:hypothetical protein
MTTFRPVTISTAHHEYGFFKETGGHVLTLFCEIATNLLQTGEERSSSSIICQSVVKSLVSSVSEMIHSAAADDLNSWSGRGRHCCGVAMSYRAVRCGKS